MLSTASVAFLLLSVRWQVQAADSVQSYPRLPTDLSPIFYEWTVKIFLPADDDDRTIEESKKFTIEGEVKIQIQCHEETNVVVLHQKNLTIDRQSVSLMPENGDRFSLIDIIIENKTEMVFFEFDQKMKKNGKYTLRLNYTGLIHDDLEGIYNSSYIGGLKNTKRYLIATQMEPLAARRALPCFDEPHFKAVFRVTIIHPINTRALSNGMELREQPIDIHWQRTIFKDSPKMSSYLLAIAVFLEEYEDYGYMSADPMTVPTSVKHIRFRTFARYKVLDQTRYALDVGPKIMAFLQRHLGMEYPLDKCDMIALPHFNFGAMENWGLITYRESALLYDPDVSKLTHKMGVAAIIAHELAHQWFGNVVTMDWWSDLWLNEGFATFMQMEALSEIEPSFNMNQVFVESTVLKSKATDQLQLHPLNVKIEKINDIAFAIDEITYQKGGSYLRMIQRAMNKDESGAFERSLQTYLQLYKYDNTNYTNLLATMAKEGNQVNQELYNMMLSWVLQMGFPLVTVKRTEDKSVQISQERFMFDADNEGPDKYTNTTFSFRWYVPVFYHGIRNAGPYDGYLTLTPNDSQPITILGVPDDKWILINTDAIGYYRVLYDKRSYELLADALKTNTNLFSVETRCQLLDDVFTLVEAGRLTYQTAFKMSEYLKLNEKNAHVWKVAIHHLNKMMAHLVNTTMFDYFRDYMKNLLREQYSAVAADDYEPSGFLDESMQETIMETMCVNLIDSDCQNKTVRMFEKHRVVEKCGKQKLSSKCNSLKPALRFTIYCSVVRLGGQNVLDSMVDWCLREDNHIEKGRISEALYFCSNKAWSLNCFPNVANYGSLVLEEDEGTVVHHDIHVSPKRFVGYAALASSDFAAAAVQIQSNDNWMQQHYDDVNNWLMNRIF